MPNTTVQPVLLLSVWKRVSSQENNVMTNWEEGNALLKYGEVKRGLRTRIKESQSNYGLLLSQLYDIGQILDDFCASIKWE